MTTKEFIKKVKELDFVGGVIGLSTTPIIEVIDKERTTLVRISNIHIYSFNTEYPAFKKTLTDSQRESLFNLCLAYIVTPIRKRDTAKYQLLFKIGDNSCLHTDIGKISKVSHFWLDTTSKPLFTKNTFTQVEIDEIKAKYGADCLDSFEQVEVKE